ncbi:FAD-binding oxidoreductase [Amycolatopsis alba]|uniref:FAD-binding oxidoreductase n=1 Tax=Amycolatopsis alba DSM 44262 TaxID=1125972 RepID=A0A229RB73_AMYAL|nr:FAD-binding oxidoreductase [Amycolatopsis alba]OXM43923.1 FAD-binding oxidoreductase [Amycolatopsis alba DSM 44262]
MELDRRTVLRLAGAVPVLAAVPLPDGGDEWERLRARLAGTLFRPGDPGYDKARLGFFSLYDHRLPAGVAVCANEDDVRRCVDFAARLRIPIAARSGGHSYVGYSIVDRGLIVDLSRLSRVEILPGGRAAIGAGAVLGRVYEALAAAGRALPAGSCPQVGIAGLTLGGGIGVLGRKYGLTCDRVESVRFVGADGKLRLVSAETAPDLLWALRGGGGGNFGIVTSFVFKTEPARTLTNFTLTFPPAVLADLVAAWQEWQPAMPDELWSGMGLGSAAVNCGGCFVGRAVQLNPLLDDLVRRVGTEPLTREVKEQGHLATMRSFAEEVQFPAAVDQRGEYVATSRMLTHPVPDPGALAALLTSDPQLYSIVDTYGGAIARVPSGESCFPHRSALGSIQITRGLDGGVAKARQEIGRVRDELGREYGQAGYVNYIDPEMPDWAKAYYGESLPRLRRVARKYDPDGLFAFEQGLAR